VDLLKDAIKEMYKVSGVAVRVDSFLEPTSSPRAVVVVIEVHKQ
jgi:hypothetical protein